MFRQSVGVLSCADPVVNAAAAAFDISYRASVNLLSWAYVRQGVYFWAYGTPVRGYRFSAFSYAKPSDFRHNFRPTQNDEANQ